MLLEASTSDNLFSHGRDESVVAASWKGRRLHVMEIRSSGTLVALMPLCGLRAARVSSEPEAWDPIIWT